MSANHLSTKKIEEAREVFRSHGGILRTSEVLKHGVHRRTLYGMRDFGELEVLSRGLYRLVDMPELSDPDLVTIAHRIPDGVICLISALHFHKITTQIPHVVSVAIKRGKEKPRVQYPPNKIYTFSGDAFSDGIETHVIDATKVRVYSPEKTLADIFKFRDKIGTDTLREAMDMYKRQMKPKPRNLLKYAKVCRVEKHMRPYLEAVL